MLHGGNRFRSTRQTTRKNQGRRRCVTHRDRVIAGRTADQNRIGIGTTGNGIIAAAAIDVPVEHIDNGIVGPPVPLGSVGGLLRIKSSSKPPKNPLVAVQHHGFWFYIDGTDSKSKTYFRWLQILITLRLSNAPPGAQLAPVLTVPVSR